MSAPYYDGDFDTATLHGPILNGVDPDSRGQIWTETMIQRASMWSPLARDTAGTVDGYLTDESAPTPFGADLVTWQRTFREVPSDYSEGVGYSYIFPQGEGAFGTVSTTVTMVHHFELTSAPEEIEILRKTQFSTAALLSEFLGGLESDVDLIIADDSKIERAWGNIWRRKTPYVTKATLQAALGLTTTFPGA